MAEPTMTLTDAAAHFFAYMEQVNYPAEVTREKRRGLILRFCQAFDDRFTLKKLEASHIVHYRTKHLMHLMPQSRRQHKVALERWLSWCRDSEYPMRSVSIGYYFGLWPKEKEIKTDRIRHTAQTLVDMLDVARDEYDRAAWAICLGTLARAETIRHILVEDVHHEVPCSFHGGIYDIHLFDTKTGDKTHYIPLTWPFIEEIPRWLSFYATEMGQPVQPDWYFFPRRGRMVRARGEAPGTMRSGPLRPYDQAEYIDDAIKRTLESAEEEDKGQGPHMIRASLARELWLAHCQRLNPATGELHTKDSAALAVMAMLNHKNLTTTMRYVGEHAGRELRDQLFGNNEQGFVSMADPHTRVSQDGISQGQTAQVINVDFRRKRA